MTTPPAGSSSEGERRRAWLERLEPVARRVFEDLASSDDPAARRMAPAAEALCKRLRDELEGGAAAE